MNIYFSCSLTGGRDDQPIYAAIVDHLLAQGHEVPTALLARPEVMDYEHKVDPVEIYARDVRWVRGCDALVAEVSTPSHGVGYEIALALALGKPVLCVYRERAPVSKMIAGNTEPRLLVRAYADSEGALRAVAEFVDGARDGKQVDR